MRLEKKSEIVRYFPGRLYATIGLSFYAINYAIFSGLIYIVLPGFKGEKPLSCCLTGNLNIKE